MRALRLAKLVTSGKKPTPAQVAERESLSSQEHALFLHALTAAASGGDSASLEHRARLIDSGGEFLDTATQVWNHLAVLRKITDDERGRLAAMGGGRHAYAPISAKLPGVDDIAGAHVCTADLDTLKPVTIADLRKGSPTPGVVLWVKVLHPVTNLSSVAALVEDSAGRVVALAMYNFVRGNALLAEAQATIPVGARLALKEPYGRTTWGRGGSAASRLGEGTAGSDRRRRQPSRGTSRMRTRSSTPTR
jgi:hypothetical protein